MSIQTITIEELRRMEGKEGIILQGCGGPRAGMAGRDQRFIHERGIVERRLEVYGLRGL